MRDCWKKVLNNWDTLTKSQKALYYFLMSWEIKDNPASQIVGKLEEKGQRFNGAGKNKKKY